MISCHENNVAVLGISASEVSESSEQRLLQSPGCLIGAVEVLREGTVQSRAPGAAVGAKGSLRWSPRGQVL